MYKNATRQSLYKLFRRELIMSASYAWNIACDIIKTEDMSRIDNILVEGKWITLEHKKYYSH